MSWAIENNRRITVLPNYSDYICFLRILENTNFLHVGIVRNDFTPSISIAVYNNSSLPTNTKYASVVYVDSKVGKSFIEFVCDKFLLTLD